MVVKDRLIGHRRLLDAYREVINDFQSDAPIFIGGKSMGGRMASLVVEQTKVSG